VSAVSRGTVPRPTAAIPALALAPAALARTEPDPVVILGIEADKRLRFAEQPHDSDEAQNAASDRWFEFIGRIAATPATSAAGVAVKLRIVQYDMDLGETIYTDDLVAGAIADLERLAGRTA
jgi:hypothetical protein